MLTIGVDSTKFPGGSGKPATWLLERAAELGLGGVYFRSILLLSASLDPVELRDVMQAASALGQRVEAGAGKVNPFATPESPEIRALGDGDYLYAMQRMVEAAAGAGIHELWSATANYQFRFSGLYACDRFRTDITWPEQLAATTGFLHRLAPVLRDNGVHLNVETHEEITSFELVRLVEAVGSDALGITFDPANVVVRGEDPVAASRRVAPYVRASHMRDVALVLTRDGFSRFLLPVGDGVIDWISLLRPLAATGIMLSIEGILARRAEMYAQIYDEPWQNAHPDLTVAEALELVRLALGYDRRVVNGTALGLEQLREPVEDHEPLEFILRSAQRLRELLAELDDKTDERRGEST